MMAIRAAFSACLLLLLLLAALCSAQKSPQFRYPQSSRIMLSWGDQWEVGVSNRLAFLNKDKRLTIHINVEGGDAGGSMRKLLVYKCTETDSPAHIDLAIIQPQTIYCETNTPFLLSKKGHTGVDYDFMIGDWRMTYSSAFTQRIELSVRVEYASGYIVSNSLFVHNLDAISKFNNMPISEPGVIIDTYSKRYLTSPALNFLLLLNMTGNQFDSFEFIDREIINLIANAPNYIKSKINIGAVLQFDSGDCKNFQSHLTSMFVNNYYSKMNEPNINLLKSMGLSLDDGRIYYSTYGLSTAVSKFFAERNPKEVGICTLTSFAGHYEPYFNVDEVKQKIPASRVSYKQVGSRTSDCFIVGPGSTKSVNMYAGMDYTALVCPIICADPNQPYKFYHGNQQLVPNGASDWTDIRGIRVSKTGNVIEFPPELFKRGSGEYRCEAGNQKFSFDVQIIAMPQFVTKRHDVDDREVLGSLPGIVYAMENESLSYNCTVFYTSMGAVAMTPRFYPSFTGFSSSWKELGLEDFKRLFSRSDPVVKPSENRNEESNTLTIFVPRVPPSDSSTNLNFTHRFVCDASVGQEDAKKVGLPSYSVQSGSNVFFLNRPTMKSFNLTLAKSCSMQKCSTRNGGYFEVSLHSELTEQLRELGVKVDGFFKLDNGYLFNNHILHPKEVSETIFDPDTNRLLFKVHPITNERILTELQKYKTLTPVFNFKYAAEPHNLMLHKEQYGPPDVSADKRDCRADSLCFYSTDFDASALGELAIEMGFVKDGQPEAAPYAANIGLISGVVLAAIIVLVAIVLLVLLLRRDPGQTYMVDEKERQQGNNPDLEAKEEVFKEYQRPEEAALNARRMSMHSNVSVVSRDDRELDAYKDDDLDYTKFTEEGSFIGEYTDQDKQGTSGKRDT